MVTLFDNVVRKIQDKVSSFFCPKNKCKDITDEFCLPMNNFQLYEKQILDRPDKAGLEKWVNLFFYKQIYIKLTNDFVSYAKFSVQYGFTGKI